MNTENHPSELAFSPESFAMRFTSTRRGARLARLLAVQRLDAWGVPYGSAASDAIALVVGELAANAATHGHVPGRDFELRLALDSVAGTAHVEVSDARSERLPATPDGPPPAGTAESGHGLMLVEEFTTKWGVTDRSIGKTVWAVCPLTAPAGGASRPPVPPAGRREACSQSGTLVSRSAGPSSFGRGARRRSSETGGEGE